jgi:hypothetical protein
MFCNRSERPCSKHWTYSSKSAGERHDKTLHWEERRSRQRVAPGANYVIPCQDCRHTFESVGLLKRHYNNSGCKPGTKQVYRYWERRHSMITAKKITGPLAPRKRGQQKLRPDALVPKREVEKLRPSKPTPTLLIAPQLPTQLDNDVGSCSTPQPGVIPNNVARNRHGRRRTREPNIADGPSTHMRGGPGMYDGHVNNFNVPPDDVLIPEAVGLGKWVFVCFEGYEGRAHRGIVTNRVKGASLFTVRCHDDDGVKPADYDLDRSVLFATREEAEESYRLKSPHRAYDFQASDSDPGDDASDSDSQQHGVSLTPEVGHPAVQGEVRPDINPRQGKRRKVLARTKGNEQWLTCQGISVVGQGRARSSRTFTELPDTSIQHIVTMLDARRVTAFLQTCARFKMVGSSDVVWSKLSEVVRDPECLSGTPIVRQIQGKFMPLTPGQTTLAAGVLGGDMGDSTVFANLPASFDVDSIERLKPGGWLNDEVVDEYMRILNNERSNAFRFYGSHAWTKLVSDGFEGIRRWAVSR